MNETEAIDQYILSHIDPEGDYLHRLYRATNIHTMVEWQAATCRDVY